MSYGVDHLFDNGTKKHRKQRTHNQFVHAGVLQYEVARRLGYMVKFCCKAMGEESKN